MKNIEIHLDHVNFAITWRCNANCQHCSINAEDAEDVFSGEMATSEILAVIEQLDRMGVSLLGITGGEAILHPDIAEILEYCKNKNIFVSIASNGMALTSEAISMLKEKNVKSVLVSIDHILPEYHDAFRGVEGCYARAIEAIKECVSKKISTTIGFTPTKNTYFLLPQIIRLGLRLGVQAINISSFVPTGRGSKELDLTPSQWKEFYSLCKMHEKLQGGLRLQYHDPRLAATENYASVLHYYGCAGCLAGISHCYILPNGDVHPCVMLPVVLGNITTESLPSILEKGKTLLYRDNLKGACEKCKNKYVCGGCRAVAFAYYNDVKAEDPRCWVREIGKK